MLFFPIELVPGPFLIGRKTCWISLILTRGVSSSKGLKIFFLLKKKSIFEATLIKPIIDISKQIYQKLYNHVNATNFNSYLLYVTELCFFKTYWNKIHVDYKNSLPNHIMSLLTLLINHIKTERGIYILIMSMHYDIYKWLHLLFNQITSFI